MLLNLAIASILLFSVSCSKKNNGDSQAVSPLKDIDQRTVTEQAKLVLEASNVRSQNLSLITSSETNSGTKLVAAKEYFLAQNFQQVIGMSQDNLEALYLNAVNDFINSLEDIHSNIRLNRMSPLKANGRNEEKAFYALSIAMDVRNKGQHTSFYDLIKKAFINEANGEILAPHERLIIAGHNKQVLTDLIKARVDMTAAQGLKYLTNKDDMTFSQATKKLFFDATGGMIGAVDLPETFNESNEVTRDFAVFYMKESLKAKNFLREFAITKDLEKVTRSAYMHLDLDLPKRQPREELSEEEENKVESMTKILQSRKAELRNLINNLLQ